MKFVLQTLKNVQCPLKLITLEEDLQAFENWAPILHYELNFLKNLPQRQVRYINLGINLVR